MTGLWHISTSLCLCFNLNKDTPLKNRTPYYLAIWLMGNTSQIKSLTSEVFADSRIVNYSTNKKEDKDEEDEAPLQPGQLLPFLRRTSNQVWRTMF